MPSWGGGGGLAEILGKSRAHLLFLQELHADKAKDKELRSLAGKLGWKCISSSGRKRNCFAIALQEDIINLMKMMQSLSAI